MTRLGWLFFNWEVEVTAFAAYIFIIAFKLYGKCNQGSQGRLRSASLALALGYVFSAPVYLPSYHGLRSEAEKYILPEEGDSVRQWLLGGIESRTATSTVFPFWV